MSINPLSMWPAEVQQRTRRMLGEEATGSDLWSLMEISRYVSDAYIEAARESKAIEFIEAIATTADTAEYTLSDNMGQVLRVVYDGYKVYNTTKWELDRFQYDWENLSGYVSNYIVSLQDNRTIRLFKAPSVGGGVTVSGGEYGVVESISDSENTYMFSAEYGEISDSSGTDWDADFVGEYGLAIITGGTTNNFFVWGVKHPGSWGLINPITGSIGNFATQMELPFWSQMGVAFRAAANALRKYGEQAEAETADVYDRIAQDYMSLLKGFVAQRSSERLTAMGRGRNKHRRPAKWERLIED